MLAGRPPDWTNCLFPYILAPPLPLSLSNSHRESTTVFVCQSVHILLIQYVSGCLKENVCVFWQTALYSHSLYSKKHFLGPWSESCLPILIELVSEKSQRHFFDRVGECIGMRAPSSKVFIVLIYGHLITINEA